LLRPVLHRYLAVPLGTRLVDTQRHAVVPRQSARGRIRR